MKLMLEKWLPVWEQEGAGSAQSAPAPIVPEEDAAQPPAEGASDEEEKSPAGHSLLDGEPEGAEEEQAAGEGETAEGEQAEAAAAFDRDAVIADLDPAFVAENTEQLDSYFELVSTETDPTKLAKGSLEILQGIQEGWAKAISADWDALQDTWKAQAREHPKYGGEKFAESAATAREVAGKYGGESFLTLLRDTGAGNHAEMIAFLNEVAAALPKEGKPVMGAPRAAAADLASRLFPSRSE